jgi:hypothetical protein
VTFLAMTGLTGGIVEDDLHAAALPAFFAAAAMFTVVIDLMVGILIALAAAIILSYQVARIGERYRREHWLLVFVAALPLGAGTVFGGMVLLYRRLYDTANQPIA